MEVDFSGAASGGDSNGKGKGGGDNGNSGKRLIVQPAAVRILCGIPNHDASVEPNTYFIYSPAGLVN